MVARRADAHPGADHQAAVFQAVDFRADFPSQAVGCPHRGAQAVVPQVVWFPDCPNQAAAFQEDGSRGDRHRGPCRNHCRDVPVIVPQAAYYPIRCRVAPEVAPQAALPVGSKDLGRA